MSFVYSALSIGVQPVAWIFGKLFPGAQNPALTFDFTNCPTISVNPRHLAKVDTQLIVQSPGHVTAFRTQMEFVVKHSREYDRNDVTVVVIIVGAVLHKRVVSSNFQNQAMFEQALTSTAYLGHCTQVSVALKVARENYMSSYRGRPGVKKMALFMNKASDCGDETSAVYEANKIKLMVSEVVVVSVGAANRTFLDRLASKSDNVLTYSNEHELIERGSGQLKQITARVAPKYDPVADILFIIDSSQSIGPADYEKELNFVVGLIEHFNIGERAARFSAVLFSSWTQTLFQLGTTDHVTIKQLVLQAPYLQGSTNTSAALSEAGQAMMTRARPDKKKIVIVITDGQSNDSRATQTAALTLKNSGVRVIAIGVGRGANQQELRAIASTPDDVNYVDTFNVLQTIYDKIAEMTSS